MRGSGERTRKKSVFCWSLSGSVPAGSSLSSVSSSVSLSPKIIADFSPIHGRGVFATEKIFKGEIIEECHFIELDDKVVEVVVVDS